MAAAADGFFRNVYEGCISGCDSGIERRPYHRNCSCALHSKSNNNNNKSRNNCHKCKKNVSYPMRRAWSEGSLLVLATANSSYSSSPSSSSPALEKLQLGSSTTLRIEEEEEEDQFSLFIKVDIRIVIQKVPCKTS
ncbi:hypothetical protein Ddye_021842 [Dipteronia dyeriana]|uniref:Uncharacterized protein n=1 Tax=Dipteronia dyeriana TaxID=168575 RepID=A0AAD9U2Y6_9ROSI|nr:hypothetical protein Ddye_021842 [Dipteronia dyeriana]